MKKAILFSLGLIVALSSCLVSCEDDIDTGTSNCKVYVSAHGSGSAYVENHAGTPAKIQCGKEVTVVATPETGIFFIGWYIDGTQVSTESTYTFTVFKTVSLTARFSEINDRTKITRDIYERELSEDEVSNAISVLKDYMWCIPAGAYCLRGGKEGALPGEHAYQRQYSYGPDLYAQYFVIPHKDFVFFGGQLTSTYDLSAKFNGNPLGAYAMAKSNFIPVLTHQEINNIPEIKAITLLYYCLSAQENADLSGPFTYIEDRLNTESPTWYDDLKTIYHDIANSLDDIVACLKHYETNRPAWYKEEIKKVIKNFDFTRSYNTGDYSMRPYIKLANSLKLRMAMHIVKVEPQTAKEWAEEAVASGVIEDIGEQMGFFIKKPDDTRQHPLIAIQSWGDIRMSASLESLLMSLNHPYTKTLFKKNDKQIVNREDGSVLKANTKICGIRSGVYVGTGQVYAENQYQAYSTFNSDVMCKAPIYFIKWSEVDLLRAEGALRGWDMGGSAQLFYERGITNAAFADPSDIDLYGKTYAYLVKDYMAQTKATPYTNIDPIGDGEPWESVTKIGVKWNENDTKETKLEKIITQKYLALFPLSTEAWAELRRTGYPKLFPVLNTDDGDGSIAQGEMIRRIPWVPTDPSTMNAVNNSAVPALGGPDEQATRLWWDIDAPNF